MAGKQQESDRKQSKYESGHSGLKTQGEDK